MNPKTPMLLCLTVDIIITSSSPPWKPSTVETFTEKPSLTSPPNLLSSVSWIATTWALYGDMTPTLTVCFLETDSAKIQCMVEERKKKYD